MRLLHRFLHPLRVVALVTVALLSMSGAAAAATDAGTPLQPGWNIMSATVACPGAPQRTLTSVQAATFLQSWLPDALYGKLKAQDPPPGVTRCTVTTPWTITGQPAQAPALIGYATNGTRVWIRLPPAKWSIARQTQRVVDSFQGRGIYVPVATTPTTTASTATTAAPKQATSHGSSSKWLWLAVPAALAFVFVLARMRSQRGRAAPRRSSPQPATSSAKRRS